MRSFYFLLLFSLNILYGESSSCNDPLYTMLQKRASSQSTNLYSLLEHSALEEFRENNQNWSISLKQLCNDNDCECLINQYQQRNIELSQKLLKVKSEINTKIIHFTGEDSVCGFSKTFPKNMVIYAAGAYKGMISNYRIGEKGEKASVFRVIVNSPKQPVALILGTYDTAIWEISWTEGTKIEAVYVMGYHTQAIAGLPKTVPISLISIDKKYGCGSFVIREESLSQINPLSNKLFHKNVDQVYYASNGYLYLGDPISEQELLFTSADTSILSLHRADAPLQKEEALYDAVSKGILRSTTPEDLESWIAQLPKNKTLPTVVTPNPEKRKPFVHNGYMILKPFVIPEGLYGGYSATFFLKKGVPMPTGDLGHSSLYDFNTMTCKGTTCNLNGFGF